MLYLYFKGRGRWSNTVGKFPRAKKIYNIALTCSRGASLEELRIPPIQIPNRSAGVEHGRGPTADGRLTVGRAADSDGRAMAANDHLLHPGFVDSLGQATRLKSCFRNSSL